MRHRRRRALGKQRLPSSVENGNDSDSKGSCSHDLGRRRTKGETLAELRTATKGISEAEALTQEAEQIRQDSQYAVKYLR